MADPLLTSLCGICHVSAPKYKCPRCGLRTCSLGCIKKHKAWSDCSGARDATAYVPRRGLRTAAGIDHDYNFLHGVERGMERAERVAVRDRGLVREEELRPATVQEVRWRVGRDGKRRKVVVTRALREAKGRALERMLAQRLRRLGVTVLCAPAGMARQRENATTLNRRTGRVNWQVEWLALGDAGGGGGEGASRGTRRVLCKSMDDVPLHQAYRNALEEQAKMETRSKNPTKDTRDGNTPRKMHESAWQHRTEILQNPYTGAWIPHKATDTDIWMSKGVSGAQESQYQFFLARPHNRSDLPATVTRLAAKDCLRGTLANTRVLEFPTICVLPAGETLPEGFVLGPKDTTQQQGMKRKGGAAATQQDKRRAAKKRKQGGRELEEGEVGSGDEGGGGNNSEGDNDGVKGGAGLEAGEVIDEQSFGEDDDDEDEGEDESEDDSTSSSGSDSD